MNVTLHKIESKIERRRSGTPLGEKGNVDSVSQVEDLRLEARACQRILHRRP